MEEIYYHLVPDEIKELMGDREYKYIHGHTGPSWRNSTFGNGWFHTNDIKKSKPKLENTESRWTVIPKRIKNLDDFVDALVKIQNEEKYISATIEYSDEEFSITVTRKLEPTPEKIQKYEEDLAIYNYELKLYKQLTDLIKKLSTEDNIWKEKYEELKAEMDKIKAVLKNEQ